MKLALVHLRQRGTGGTERYLNQVAAHLAREGHAVTIVCRSHEAPPHPAVRFVRLRSPAIGSSWRLWAFAREVERHVRTAGYDLVYALGRSWSHDIIRLGGGCHATHLDALDVRRPVLGLGDRVVLAIERRALDPGAYRRIVTNSEMSRREVMTRYGAPAERVSVIRNGVDLERFDSRRLAAEAAALRRAYELDDDAFVVLFLGTGYRRKGLDRLLDAFPLVLRRNPAARLLVVGYDSAAATFERRGDRLGLSTAVRFLGGRRDAEVCFAAADLYVLPTRYDPFASSTLEALASGLPVVTTATNGASEILTPRRHGSILPAAFGPERLAEEILAWEDPERRHAAGSVARDLARSFPEARSARESAALLEAVWESKRGTTVTRGEGR